MSNQMEAVRAKLARMEAQVESAAPELADSAAAFLCATHLVKERSNARQEKRMSRKTHAQLFAVQHPA